MDGWMDIWINAYIYIRWTWLFLIATNCLPLMATVRFLEESFWPHQDLLLV